MKMNKILLLMTLSPLLSVGANAGSRTGTWAEGACTSEESWHWSASIGEQARSEFHRLLSESVSAAHGFSDGVAQERSSSTAEGRALGEYWKARALWSAGLVDTSFEAFSRLLARSTSPETIGVQLAALECVSRIHAAHPAQSLSQVSESLPGLARLAPRDAREAVWSFAAERWIEGGSQPALAALSGAGPYEDVAQGLAASARKDWAQAASRLERVLSPDSSGQGLPARLARFADDLRMSAGRAQYALGHFDQAITHYRRVSFASRHEPRALTELAWAQLMAGRRGDAIGVVTAMLSGNEKSSFAPEAPLVMSMALNELCQYPDSLAASRRYKSDYADSIRWLSAWFARPEASRPSLYSLAVEALRAPGRSPVPARVASEWLRTPAFGADQQEISRLFAEPAQAARFFGEGDRELHSLAAEIRDEARDVGAGVRDDVDGLRVFWPGRTAASAEAQPASPRLDSLVERFNRLQAGMNFLRPWIRRQESLAAGRRQKLVEGLEAELVQTSRRMLAQLSSVTQSARLVEVEIHNGASHDLIFRGAHPEYAQVARAWKDEDESVRSSRVWKWGGARTTSDGKLEIWSDEVGSFKARIFDNCSSQDRYVALLKRRG
jgi:tetratricopeptide (TPR) repeat protein